MNWHGVFILTLWCLYASLYFPFVSLHLATLPRMASGDHKYYLTIKGVGSLANTRLNHK